LLLISVYLMRLGRPTKAILAPMIFIFIMAFWASCWYIVSHYQNGQWALVIIEVLVMITSIMVMLEALGVISKIRSGEIAIESADAANTEE
jgi:carbon starvation protein